MNSYILMSLISCHMIYYKYGTGGILKNIKILPVILLGLFFVYNNEDSDKV